MELKLTEEQRKRAEANRLAAIAKRKALAESNSNVLCQQNQDWSWRLSKCPKLGSGDTHFPQAFQDKSPDPASATNLSGKFRVRLEICSPNSFSAAPDALKGFAYPGEEECLRRLNDLLSDVMPSHYTQNHGGGKACVYKLRDYSAVLSCLKKSKGIEVEEIPHVTLRVVEKFSHSYGTGQWKPLRPDHLTDVDVDELIRKLPRTLLDALLPFQLDGVRFGLRRGGRCLIADEMGLGKTLQAIAIAGCFINEGSILVVCPAVLRYSWAEELERWLPFCLPSDIHLVFGHRDNPIYLLRCPKVVVISYTMLKYLRKSMLEREWAILIVDESHHLRCSKKKTESEEIKAVLDVAGKVRHIVLLSGTPSLSRPYDIFHQINMLWPSLLGKSKYEFAKTYCSVNFGQKRFKDFSKGIRLQELSVLLKLTVMIRRLKEHVLVQLPPKRRQIIRLRLNKSDIASAKAAIGVLNTDACEKFAAQCTTSEKLEESGDAKLSYRSGELSYQELGIAKLPGFREWLSIHPLISKSNDVEEEDSSSCPRKMIIFAHHHKVLDGVQDFICEKGIGFVRIDGNTLPKDRQAAVLSFRSSNEARIAIIGVTAAGVGLDFSSAQNVVFLELPQSPSLMLQAEDRAHRRGQKSAVNVYIFCAKDTIDESHWKYLNKSLHRVSSTTNGKYDAIKEIEVERVSSLGTPSGSREGHFMEKAASFTLSAELTFPFHDHLEDMHHSEACTEASIEQSQNGHRDLHNYVKGHIVPDLQIDKNFVSMEREEELHTSAADIVSSYKLVMANDDHNVLQDVQGHKFCPQPIRCYDGASIKDVECSSNQLDSLRFEVSQYTGRIHLYYCFPGTDSRPSPLFESFRPEELESENSSPADDNKETVVKSFKDNPAYRHALWTFIDEWSKLRPIEKRKLIGKPLQLPLSVELCYLKESINHNTEGLLRGGSKRRTTPLYEISIPLPENAVWKKVHLCGGHRKREIEYTQGWTLTDEPLCKLCQKPCKGGNAKTPEYFEDLFCNITCYEEYRIRTSNRFLREELFQIEHGVCTNCQLDCHQLVKHLKPLSLERRRQYIEKVAPQIAGRKKLVEKLVSDPSEGNAWHADHIVPVYRGGGECRLENMRTLCVACHSDVTAAQCAERRLMRTKAKKRLKAVMRDLKNNETINESATDQELSEIAEDELLVKVPGSAYSGGNNSGDLS